MAPHNYDPLQKPPPPWPLPPGNIQLSPTRSGPFASRGDAHLGEALNGLQSQLAKVSDNVSTVQEDFNELAERSRYNGEALEKLMLEIKGVREDDGVSRKLTGLARLDKLDEFAQVLNERLSPESFSSHLKGISEEIDSLRISLSDSVQSGPLARELASFKQQLTQSIDKSQFDELHSMLVAERAHADSEVTRRLDEIFDTVRKTELRSEESLDSAQCDILTKLEDLRTSVAKQQEALNTIQVHSSPRELQGEVRAIQDHLLGAHTTQSNEVKRLNEVIMQKDVELADFRQRENLQVSEQELKDRIQGLQRTEMELIGHNGELKADLKHHVARLEELQDRYNALERSLRDMTLSKYKGLLGSGSMAVLSMNKNKENEPEPLKLPKRQLRSVSLMDRI